MVICLEQGADLHMAQLMPLPLTVSCFSKIQTGFTFLVPAHPGNPGKRAVKRVCVFVCVLHLGSTPTACLSSSLHIDVELLKEVVQTYWEQIGQDVIDRAIGLFC